MKNFKVTTKCGHVGKNNYILIDFAISAENRKNGGAVFRFTLDMEDMADDEQ